MWNFELILKVMHAKVSDYFALCVEFCRRFIRNTGRNRYWWHILKRAYFDVINKKLFVAILNCCRPYLLVIKEHTDIRTSYFHTKFSNTFGINVWAVSWMLLSVFSCGCCSCILFCYFMVASGLRDTIRMLGGWRAEIYRLAADVT
jgi:hypothetical protein